MSDKNQSENQFENDPQDTRNDFSQAGTGFTVTVAFLTVIFAIGVATNVALGG